MTKEHQIQAILDRWREEYGITQPVKFDGWKNMDEGGRLVLGKCFNYTKRSEIYLGDRWEDRELGWLETSVLWHEFCHANAFLEDGVGDGHNDHFMAYKFRKKKYFFGDLIAKVVFGFL